MKNDLSSSTFNWNASVGSISALTLSSEVPAINLHTYKFYYDRAILWEVYRSGVKLEPVKIVLKWHTHKMESEVHFDDFVLTLDAFFVDEEVITVRYAIDAPREMALDVVITGMVRNGKSSDTFFTFRGQVEGYQKSAVIDQELDIPEYRSKPLGPFPSYTHHHLWMIDSPDAVEVSTDQIERKHLERISLDGNDYSAGTNRSNYWRIKKKLSGKTSEPVEGHFFIGTRWMGAENPTLLDYKNLGQKIQNHKARHLDLIEDGVKEYWDHLLARIPAVKERYRNNPGYCDLYRKAWVCILQNVAGSLVTSQKTIKGPTVMVAKVCSAGFGPAQWETSLGGFMLSFINPDFGAQVIESVLNSVEVTGFIPEDLIFNRDVKLSSYEPFMLEYIYQRTGDIKYLERNYDNAWKQLVYHIDHPGFYYLEPPSMRAWLFMGNYYSLQAMERIAVILGKSAAEIQRIREYISEVTSRLGSLLPETLDEPLEANIRYSAIYSYWDESKSRKEIEFIRSHMFPPDDQYFLYRSPDGKQNELEDLQIFKMEGYLFFILALERFQEDALLDRVAEKTYAGLVKNGDFWENYFINSVPQGNGPMSIFGAFGWIWTLMDKGRPKVGPLI